MWIDPLRFIEITKKRGPALQKELGLLSQKQHDLKTGKSLDLFSFLRKRFSGFSLLHWTEYDTQFRTSASTFSRLGNLVRDAMLTLGVNRAEDIEDLTRFTVP